MKRSGLPARKTPLPRGKPPARTAWKPTPTAIARSSLRRRTPPAALTTARTAAKPGDGPLRAAPARRKAPRDAAAADAFRAAVMARAARRCEACPVLAGSGEPRAVAVARRCPGLAAHAHHISPRGAGGHADHSPDNGIACCDAAHRLIHDRPAIGYATGLLRRRS